MVLTMRFSFVRVPVRFVQIVVAFPSFGLCLERILVNWFMRIRLSGIAARTRGAICERRIVFILIYFYAKLRFFCGGLREGLLELSFL